MFSDLSTTQNIFITGCNRGLGLALTIMLLQKNPNTYIFGTTRSNKQELQTKLKQKTKNDNLTILQLDVTSRKSIIDVVAELTARDVHFDAIVNNSGIYLDDKLPKYDVNDGNISQQDRKQINRIRAEGAQQMITTNFYGSIMLTNNLLPFLKDNGRVINVSSRCGALKDNGPSIQKIFTNPEISIGDIDLQISRYIDGCEKGDNQEYSSSPYGVSKMMLNCWSRFILKRMLKPTQQAITMSPGYCRTDMSPQAPRSAEDGALSMYILLWGEYSSQNFYHCDGVSDYFSCGPQKTN